MPSQHRRKASEKERSDLAGVVALLVALDGRPRAERHVGAAHVAAVEVPDCRFGATAGLSKAEGPSAATVVEVTTAAKFSESFVNQVPYQGLRERLVDGELKRPFGGFVAGHVVASAASTEPLWGM